MMFKSELSIESGKQFLVETHPELQRLKVKIRGHNADQ